uniref:Uncharacterized protein n=1 Tax=Anguilla anguilla TaxID=7936 RepID=A0A0E9PNN8_ANGAN
MLKFFTFLYICRRCVSVLQASFVYFP